MNWDKQKLDEFEKAYERALENNLNEFEFENHEFLVSYAKYLIEFLKTKL